MYKKKEIVFVVITMLIMIIGYFILSKDEIKETKYTDSTIIINIEGELAKDVCLEYQNSVTYGTVFLRIKSLLNEYSDLSNFDVYEIISYNLDINIPTKDIGNNYSEPTKIHINSATKSELMTLPQIGEKRSQVIIEYIRENGRISSWDLFFELVKIKNDYKEIIKQQAIL